MSNGEKSIDGPHVKAGSRPCCCWWPNQRALLPPSELVEEENAEVSPWRITETASAQIVSVIARRPYPPLVHTSPLHLENLQGNRKSAMRRELRREWRREVSLLLGSECTSDTRERLHAVPMTISG